MVCYGSGISVDSRNAPFRSIKKEYTWVWIWNVPWIPYALDEVSTENVQVILVYSQNDGSWNSFSIIYSNWKDINIYVLNLKVRYEVFGTSTLDYDNTGYDLNGRVDYNDTTVFGSSILSFVLLRGWNVLVHLKIYSHD